MRRAFALSGLFLLFVGVSWSCAAGEGTDDPQCAIGSEACPCTNGGSCDAPLVCLSNLCVNPNTGGSPAQGGNSGNGGDNTGAFHGAGGGGNGQCATGGCKAVDVLFALDGSGSMTEEISALSASQSFQAVIAALANLNCGDIDYRIGVTDDNVPGFRVPNGWAGSKPWFDSTMMTDDEISAAFSGAAGLIIAGSGTPLGCEHVLSNSASTLINDATGFVRPEALLVLVLVTDVDDYGAYDNENGNDCGIGCSTVGAGVDTLYSGLVTLKSGDPKALGAIVVAGDPGINGGVNFCNQPGTCCGGGDCLVFHATRLWEFAGMQTGMNGYTANLCGGAQTVPTAVQTALGSNIDLACQEFEPPM